jgi:hypothetical protein
MVELWVIVVAFPIFAAFIGKLIWKHEFEWQEIAITLTAAVIICTVMLFAGKYTGLMDTLVLNGKVTGKDQVKVSCSHSYPCNCRTVCRSSGKSTSCSTHCDTCYEHPWDYDWDVFTTIGTFTIDRVDRRGTKEPSRWTSVQKGEPVSKTETYQNYIKGAPESLFNKALLMQKKYSIPSYPSNIYDYYHINRVVEVGVVVKEKSKLNENLNLMLRDIGPQKQVNVVAVFTNHDENFARALEAAWLGGKKNDIVVVTGLGTDQSIKWVCVFSWSKNSVVNFEIQQGIKSLDFLDVNKYSDLIAKYATKSFVRRPMAEFEYLLDDIDPPMWVVVLAGMLGFFGSLGAAYWFSKPTNRFSYKTRRYY